MYKFLSAYLETSPCVVLERRTKRKTSKLSYTLHTPEHNILWYCINIYIIYYIIYLYVIYYVNIMNNITTRNKHRLRYNSARVTCTLNNNNILAVLWKSCATLYTMSITNIRTYTYSNNNDDDNMFPVLTYLKV